MPFVSQTGKREMLQRSQEYVDLPESSFGETFGASLGLVIDEEMSTSRMLNREGWDERKSTITKLIDSGEIDSEPYLSKRGIFNYSKAARDLNRPDVKTDKQLREERNLLLAQRRTYAEEVISRGSGLAQFLGAATGFILDPISVITMGVSTAAVGAKSLSVLGTAMVTARNTAVLEAGVELAIQPLVYDYKSEIGAPYSEIDAISNIAMAATGAAAIGGITGSISGYLAKVKRKAAALPQTNDIKSALENVDRLSETLKHSPDKTIEGQAEFLQELHRKKKIADEPSIRKEDYDEPDIIDAGKVARVADKPVKAAPQEFHPAVEGMARELTEGGDISLVKDTHGVVTGRTKSINPEWYQDLSVQRVDGKGELNTKPPVKEVKEAVEAFVSGKEASPKQKRILEALDDVARADEIESNKRFAKLQEGEAVEAGESFVGSRQSELLSDQGLLEEYDKALLDYSRLDNPILPDGEDLIDADAFMKEIDDEIAGLDAIVVCANG